MKNRILSLVLSVLCLCMLTACFRMADQRTIQYPYTPRTKPPDIKITAGEQTVGYIAGPNQWDGAIYDRMDTLQVVLREGSKIVVPVVPLGETIQIVFQKNPPYSISLSDSLIDEAGFDRDVPSPKQPVTIQSVDGVISFAFQEHPSSPFLPAVPDGEQQDIYRGFRMYCHWKNGNDCEYGFVMIESGDDLN